MAKVSAVQTNLRRKNLVKHSASRREQLKLKACDMSILPKDRMEARFLLSEMPRNGCAVRIRNRCALTGRPRGTYRKFNLSRIALRELALGGMIPGMTKASW